MKRIITLMLTLLIIANNSIIAYAAENEYDHISMGDSDFKYIMQLWFRGTIEIRDYKLENPDKLLSEREFSDRLLKTTKLYIEDYKEFEELWHYPEFLDKHKELTSQFDNSENITIDRVSYLIITLGDMMFDKIVKENTDIIRELTKKQAKVLISLEHKDYVLKAMTAGIIRKEDLNNTYINNRQSIRIIARAMEWMYENTVELSEYKTNPFEDTKDKEVLTVGELQNYMLDKYGMLDMYGGFKEINRKSTIDDMLNILYYIYNGGVIVPDNVYGWCYIPCNSIIFSDTEWSWVIDNLSYEITKEDADLILSRFDKSNEYLMYTMNPTYISEYKAICENITPEYKLLMENTDEALKYWAETTLVWDDDGYHKEDKYETTLHELQHEVSAHLEGVFTGRSWSKEQWVVTMSDEMYNMSILNNKTKEFMRVPLITNIEKTEIISDNVPFYAKQYYLFRSYVDVGEDSDMASNEWGIYGIMNEFSSYTAGLRSNTILTSFNRRSILDNDAEKQHLFWKATILEYLYTLKTENRTQYEAVVNNKEFVKLIVDTIEFGDAQLGYLNYYDINDFDTVVLYDWSISDSCYIQFKRLKTLYN